MDAILFKILDLPLSSPCSSCSSCSYREFVACFRTLVAITERYFTPNYFDHNLVGAQADQLVLKEVIGEKLPQLSSHLLDIDIEVSTVTLNWFLAIFFDAVPFPVSRVRILAIIVCSLSVCDCQKLVWLINNSPTHFRYVEL